MKWLQLYREGEEMLASDGVMQVDGRLNLNSIKYQVRLRNERFKKNFPHKIADEFAVYRGRIGSEQYNRTKL